MRRPALRLVPAALLALVLTCGAAPASAAETPCTSVAGIDGSDANPGTETLPFRTVQKLVDSLQPGDTGCLRGGTYSDTSEGYIAHFDKAGTADKPITLRSFPEQRALLKGTVIVRNTAANTHLNTLSIEGNGSSNAVKVYGANFLLEDSDVTTNHAAFSCLMLGSPSAGNAVAPVLRRNLLHQCGSPANGNQDHAIYASHVRDGEIVDNVIVDPAGYAIQLYPDAQNTRFAHNVVDGGAAVRGGVVFGGDSAYASSDNGVEQNVIANAATYGITATWSSITGTDNRATRNCISTAKLGSIGVNPGFSATDNVDGDPGFADPAHMDYRLSPSSPCHAVVDYDTATVVHEAQVQAGTPMTDEGEVDAGAYFASGGSNELGGFPRVRVKRVRQKARKVSVVAKASGTPRVSKVLFLVDDVVRRTDRTAPFTAPLTVGKHARVLTVRAYNVEGRAASVSRRLRRR